MSGLNPGTRARAARLFAVGLAAAFLGAAPLAAGAAEPYRDVARALAEGLLALFPTIQGYVVSASGAEAYVDVAAKDLVRQGMELQVYRPGDQMIHPVTRQVLGAYEKDLGALTVTEVRETYSRGALDAAGVSSGIVAGDRVRLSARRLRTLLHVSGAPGGIEVGPLAQALVARGEQSGRFAMIDEPGWAPALTALGAAWETVRADPPLLRRLGEAAAADLLLLARIESGAIPGVVIEVRSLRTGAMLGELSERWPAATPAATPSPDRAAAPAAPLPAATAPVSPADRYVERDLASPARSLAAGNILGEGRLEVVLTDGARLSLYRWEGEALAWRWDEDGRRGRRVLSLDAADLDGDGTSEVLVTSVVHGRVTSELRRWQEGVLRVAATIEGVYLRAAPRSGASPLLLGQRSGIDEVLTGRVEQYRLRGGALERIEGSALPDGVGIFGLALAPEGGPVLLYTIRRNGHIAGVTLAGKEVWHSSRQYGGYPPPLSASELFGLGAVQGQDFNETARAFQGRLLAAGTPGGIRLAVPRNFSDSPVVMPSQRASGRGELAIFEGPPGSPEEVRRSRVFDGYVADLAWADIDGDGSAEILFTVNRSVGPLLGERGKLVAWHPGDSGPEKISP